METVALVKYSEEIVATYEVLTNPLNSQFLQIKSLRIFQLLTHILKSSLQQFLYVTDSASVPSSFAGETDPPPVAVPPPLRRSTRRTKAPERLNL